MTLARLIAHVALGQSRKIAHVLKELDEAPNGAPKSAFKGARKLLKAKTHGDRYHRDGWMFQVIS